MSLHRWIAFFYVLGCSASFAGFMDRGYSEWKELSAEAKRHYAAGVWDGISVSKGDAFGDAIAFGLRDCGLKLGLNNQMVAEAITGYYERHPEAWGQPAAGVFVLAVVNQVCTDHVNQQRISRGMPAAR